MSAIDDRAAELEVKLGNRLSGALELAGGAKLKGYENGILLEFPGAGVYTLAEATVAGQFLSGGGAPKDGTVVPLSTIKRVPSPNHWQGRAGHKPLAIVIHTMAGFMTGCDATFTDPASEVSAHFGVGIDGSIHQYVELEDSSWANGQLEAGHRWMGPKGVSPNRLTVTIETEDFNNPSQLVTQEQFDATLAVCRLAVQRFPSITHLLGHSVISPASRANCPGKRWIASGRFAQLARALGLQELA
jgi:hypothetical protein